MFLRRLFGLDTIETLISIGKGQQRVMHDQSRIIALQQREISRLKVEYSRWGRDMISNFLIALDKPEQEEEFRRVLDAALEDMSDEVARLEEHAL